MSLLARALLGSIFCDFLQNLYGVKLIGTRKADGDVIRPDNLRSQAGQQGTMGTIVSPNEMLHNSNFRAMSHLISHYYDKYAEAIENPET